jgi:hypothetical protein
MKRRHVVGIATVLIAFGISGCGGSKKSGSAATTSPQTPTQPLVSIPSPSPATALEPAFIAKVNAACARAARTIAAHGKFPYPGFDALRPEVRLLPKIGAFFAATQSTADRLPTELRDLGTPRKGTILWGELVALAKQARAIADRQIKAAETANVPAFVATVNEAHATSTKLGRLAITGGVPPSSPCTELF